MSTITKSPGCSLRSEGRFTGRSVLLPDPTPEEKAKPWAPTFRVEQEDDRPEERGVARQVADVPGVARVAVHHQAGEAAFPDDRADALDTPRKLFPNALHRQPSPVVLPCALRSV